MSEEQIIDVQIDLQAGAAEEVNFGVPLIAAYHTKYADVVRTYSDLDGLLADGFAQTDAVYLAAAAMLAQSPRIVEFKVGRRALPFTQVFTLAPISTLQGLVYTGSVAGNAYSYTVGASDTIATITAAIKAAIDGLSLPLTTTDSGTDVTVTANAPGALFGVSGLNAQTLFETTTADPGIATDLAAIDDADPEWYGLILDSESKAEILAAADYVAPRVKMFIASTADSAVWDSGSTTDVMAVAQSEDEPRVSIWYHENTGAYFSAAFLSGHFSNDPGSANPAHEDLNGIAVSKLSTNQRKAILDKNGNIYTTCKGRNLLQFGSMADGEWLDNIRGVDWQRDIIITALIDLLYSERKVPMDDGGLASIKGVMLAQLQRGVDNGLFTDEIAPDASVPLAKDITLNEKKTRCLSGVGFLAYLANAINKIKVRGTVTF